MASQISPLPDGLVELVHFFVAETLVPRDPANGDGIYAPPASPTYMPTAAKDTGAAFWLAGRPDSISSNLDCMYDDAPFSPISRVPISATP